MAVATDSGRGRARVWAWAPAVLCMFAISVLSSLPQPLPLSSIPFRDKGVHFVEYLGLALLLGRAFRRTYGAWGMLRVCVSAFGVALAWGYLDELHQAFVPGRDASVYDVLADALGAVTGAVLYAAQHALRGPRRDLVS